MNSLGGVPLSATVQPPLDLSVVLVSYNSLLYLGDCLNSIRQFCPLQTEVIVVDNNSADDSAMMIERDYPRVHLIRSERNLGFAGGNNLAAGAARGKFILLLNCDAVLLESISPALKWLDEHSEYALVTVDMVDVQHISRACTGRFPSPLRLAFLRKLLVPRQEYPDLDAFDIDWAQGSFLLVRADIWRSLGGLDEQYFMYFEDVDFCKRVHDAGFKCGFLPNMRYLHIGGYTPARFPTQIASLLLYLKRHMRGGRRLSCRSILLGGCLARVVWYKLRSIFLRDEASRTIADACRRALGEFYPMQRAAMNRQIRVKS